MQYHAMSFAEEGYVVDITGYGNSQLINELVIHNHVNVYLMPEWHSISKYAPGIVAYILKAGIQAVTLFISLMCRKRPCSVLVQNPPSIPSLMVVYITCKIRGSKFIIDWHNYGYTILALSVGSNNHPLVKVAKWYEHFFGKRSDGNLCVTKAMCTDLKENWEVRAITHHDRPPKQFKRATMKDMHKLFLKLSEKYDTFKPIDDNALTTAERTRITMVRKDGQVTYVPNRPAIVVSSTSWTDDEDFSLLLVALEQFENNLQEIESTHALVKSLPHVVCVITGKGPKKEHYQAEISKRIWRHVEFCTPWLEPEDYPVLLGSADLGVCLHTSSSGLDLPMKVVDMFGSGLPVCAVNFRCLSELVQHDHNGMIFHCANELHQQLEELLNGFPNKCTKLDRYKGNVAQFQALRWHECWKQNVLPLFQ